MTVSAPIRPLLLPSSAAGVSTDLPALVALSLALEARDPHTFGHAARVAQLAGVLGRALGLVGAQLDRLVHSGQLHDIGKIGVPDAVLHKPGALQPDEWELMKRHPLIGAQIVGPVLPLLVPGILHHHERWDGAGYPGRLAGLEIPIEGRILAVCDTFDALTSDRTYRGRKTAAQALAVLQGGRWQQWDGTIVDTFVLLAGQAVGETGDRAA